MKPVLARWLVAAPAAPDDHGDFTRARQSLDGGLPVEWPLGMLGMPAFNLGLTIPTGEAVRWRDADPDEVVADSTPESTSDGGDAPELVRPLLLLRSGAATLASTRLTALHLWVVPNADGLWPGALSIVAVGWRVHAGALVKPGNYGSFVDLALRFVTTAADVAPTGVVISTGGFG
jgi:hypothetical protein